MKIRFGEPSVTNCLPIFADPRTAKYAKKIIKDAVIYEDTRLYAKMEHRKVYAAMHPATVEDAEDDHVFGESAADDDDIMLDEEEVVESVGVTRRERLTSEADEIFEKWMVVKTDWGSYKNTLFPVKFKGLADLYEFADPLMWFKKKGASEYPSVALFARTILCRADHGAFQESVFSSGNNAMSFLQTSMNIERFGKRVILYHNRKWVCKNIQKYNYKL